MSAQLYYKMLILMLFGILLNSVHSNAQNCPQNNVSVSSFSLLDANGNPFTSGSNYQLGEVVNGKLYVKLAVSNSGNAYSTKIFFDLIIDGINTGRRNICLNEFNQLPTGTSVFVIDLSWKWGNEVRVKDLLMRWSTNTGGDCAGIGESGGAQCYGNAPGFTADLPVLPEFDYVATVCNPTVKFTDMTLGGKPGYTYLWNFAGLGTSTLKNPSFTFPGVGTYTVSLTSRDTQGNSNTITKQVTIPTLTINVETTPTKFGENTGTIKVDINGGTSPYSITWSSTNPTGYSGSVSSTGSSYTITNLGSATYTIVVTDAIGCRQTITVDLDWAQFLSNPWKGFDVTLDRSERLIHVDWSIENERTSCIYVIERAISGELNFEEIGRLNSSGYSEKTRSYNHLDEDIPGFEAHIYYRIKQIDPEGKLSYSKVNYIHLQAEQINLGWTAYPNPSVNNKLVLEYKGNHDLSGSPVNVRIVSALNQFETQVELDGRSIIMDQLIAPFKPGLILIQVSSGSYSESIKVIKK